MPVNFGRIAACLIGATTIIGTACQLGVPASAAARAAANARPAGAGPASTGAVSTAGSGSGSGPGTSGRGANGPAGNANPYAPAYRHAYRRGAVPPAPPRGQMRAGGRAPPRPAGPAPAPGRAATGAKAVAAGSFYNLRYGGGSSSGIGVTIGQPQVYLVFWGSQWGTASLDGSGRTVLSDDPSGEAPFLQRMFSGIGTNGELWSGVLTQYCQGVPLGSQTCPSSAPHVPYPSGSVLAGVWADVSTAAPNQATGHQLGAEAVAAAAHFGNTTAAANRNAQYVILSATGTNPDGFGTPLGGFCAWHDDTADSTLTGGAVTSPYGDIAFVNGPYITDLGYACGADFVNSGTAGLLDGVSMVIGHEYAETLTDQSPPGGWTDINGDEDADKCQWIPAGSPGGAGQLALATGTFAMQSTWANDAAGGAGGCEFTHPIVTSSTSTVTVTSPGNQSTVVNTPVSLQIRASDSAAGRALSYQATGLPAGLTISPSTGLISGHPTATGSWPVTVRAADTGGSFGTASFSWQVTPAGGIINGGFETGTLSGWTSFGWHSIVSTGAHSGRYALRAGSTSPPNGSSGVSQTFPASGATLGFWYNLTCPDYVRYDWATATLRDNTTGVTRTILPVTCVARSGWRQVTASLVIGHSYTLTLISHDDDYPGDATYTLFDDVTMH